MTAEETKQLLHHLAICTQLRPTVSPEHFMADTWLPFIRGLSIEDQRAAWLMYLEAQAKQFSVLAQYLATLSEEEIAPLRPVLENIAALEHFIRQWGEGQTMAMS